MRAGERAIEGKREKEEERHKKRGRHVRKQTGTDSPIVLCGELYRHQMSADMFRNRVSGIVGMKRGLEKLDAKISVSENQVCIKIPQPLPSL